MRWLRDPIVLFVLLGGALAALFLASRDVRSPIARDTEIVVTDADVRWLAQVYEKTWRRPPTPAELRSMVDRRVRSEILYREAVALGLDEGDEALRRRIALKLEFLAKDAGSAVEPSDAELEAHLGAHAEAYTLPPQRRFTQIYINLDKRGDGAWAHTRALLARLEAEPALDLTTIGDPFLLERLQPMASPDGVGRQFGQAFADALFRLEGNGWHGPLRSGYGLHLVRIEDALPGGTAPLDVVRKRVRADLVERRRNHALEAYIEALREKYDVEMRTTLLEAESR